MSFREARQWFAALPFTTKWVTVLSLLLPLLMKFRLVGPHWLVWHWPSIFHSLQVWRCMTALFVTGVNFNFILAIYFRYQYFFYLETGLFADRPADFLYCVLFVVLLLNVSNWFVGLASLWQPFSMAIVYLWSQHNHNVIVNFLFGFKFPARYLPFVLGVVDFLSTADIFGPLIGILVGHTYYFLTVLYVQRDPRWRSRLQAPPWLQRMVPRYVAPSAGPSSGFTVKRPEDSFRSASDSQPLFRPFSGRGQKLGQ